MNSKKILTILSWQNLTKVSLRHKSTKLAKPKLRFDQEEKIKQIKFSEYCILLIPVTTFGLGVWQVQRLFWKKGVIKELEERQSARPVALPLNDEENLSKLEYCKVYVRGQFEHDKVVYIGPKSLIKNGAAANTGGGLFGSADFTGYHVITPFKVENSNQKILVNRGWVPKSKISPSSRGEILPTDTILLLGILRKNEEKISLMPKNPEDTNKWMTRDVEALARKLDTLPIFIDADQHSTIENGPIGGQTRTNNIPNDHLTYLITWFSLSGATTFFWMSRFIWK